MAATSPATPACRSCPSRQEDRPEQGALGGNGAALAHQRQQSKVAHPVPRLLRERVYALAAGYADADDLDRLKDDPALKLAYDRRPAGDPPLASRPTVSRLFSVLRRAVRQRRFACPGTLPPRRDRSAGGFGLWLRCRAALL